MGQLVPVGSSWTVSVSCTPPSVGGGTGVDTDEMRGGGYPNAMPSVVVFCPPTVTTTTADGSRPGGAAQVMASSAQDVQGHGTGV